MALGQPTDKWQISNQAAAGTATVTQAAGAAGVRNVIKRLTASIAAGATPAVAMTVVVRDGATTAGTIKYAATLACIANSFALVDLDNLHIAGTAATAMCVEFTASGAATTVESVSADGYTL